MNKYIMLTKLLPTVIDSPESLSEIGENLNKRLKEKFNNVNWLANYAVCGPYDYLDIFEAPSNEIAMKVSVMTRSIWNGSTELWPATELATFRDLVLNFEENIHEKQPAEDMVDEAAMDSFPASDPPSTSGASANSSKTAV